ncbi:MAG: pyridoxal phosphate-dependent aminotransferase [Vulcanimicrobiota bacterium]
MTLPGPFDTELYFARYEFTARHLLAASDCQTLSVGALLELAGVEPDEFMKLTLGYTESAGHPTLREAIAARYQTLSAEDILVLGSPVEGLYLLSQLFTQDTIVLTPAYDALKNLPQNAIPWPLRATDSEWQLDFEGLERLVTPETDLLVVNFPHNPTGFVPTTEEWTRLLEWVDQRGLWLFCDEIYAGLLRPDVPRLASAADLYPRAVVLGGLSKSQGLPGLRCGWLATREPELRRRLFELKMYTSICPPAPTEFLAQVALAVESQLVARSNQIIEANLSLAEDFFARHRDLFRFRRPRGASVALVELLDGRSAQQWCYELADRHGIVLLPSTFLGWEDRFVRFGFGRTTFSEALAAFQELFSSPT